jgi:SAM-dependent methyltransferase
LVRKTDGEVIYIDYAATEVLRQQHQNSETIEPRDIVDVDFVWASRPLRECLGDRDPLDYVVAAHVIEHVPDIITWLFDVASILKEGGLLGMAIPDRRHTFDFKRNESTPGEMVEAYLRKYEVPSIRQVFDHCFLAVAVDQAESWKSDLSGLELPKFMGDMALPLAYAQAQELTRVPRYIDSHCWVFTPAGWLDNIESLVRLELFPFWIEKIAPTMPGEMEFLLRLRRCSPKDASIMDSIRRAKQVVANDPFEKDYEKRISARQAVGGNRRRWPWFRRKKDDRA